MKKDSIVEPIYSKSIPVNLWMVVAIIQVFVAFGCIWFLNQRVVSMEREPIVEMPCSHIIYWEVTEEIADLFVRDHELYLRLRVVDGEAK